MLLLITKHSNYILSHRRSINEPISMKTGLILINKATSHQPFIEQNIQGIVCLLSQLSHWLHCLSYTWYILASCFKPLKYIYYLLHITILKDSHMHFLHGTLTANALIVKEYSIRWQVLIYSGTDATRDGRPVVNLVQLRPDRPDSRPKVPNKDHILSRRVLTRNA